MPTERTPRYTHQEQTNYARTAQDLRERLQSGLLSELTPYSHFVVWKYTVEQGKLKKRPFNPRTNMPARTNDPKARQISRSSCICCTGRMTILHRPDDCFNSQDSTMRK